MMMLRWCWLLALGAGLIVAVGVAAGADELWRYLPEPQDATTFSPVYRSFTLDAEKPDDLDERVRYRGSAQRYLQIQYGTEESVRVTLVLDEISRDEFDLYVDVDRDRVIEPDELVPGDGRTRQFELGVDDVDSSEPRHMSRTLLLRRGVVGTSVSLATAGYVEGHVSIDDRKIAARRVDADANGLFSDPADRLWLDLDGDGRWSAITEQFPLVPLLRLGERRFAVRADRIGKRLELEELFGAGEVVPVIAALPVGARVSRLHALLRGEDYSVFALRAIGEPAVLPIGRYAIESVAVTIEVGESQKPWHFVFSRAGGSRPANWYKVGADETIEIELIGELRFTLPLAGDGPLRVGQSITWRPNLSTSDGLLIRISSFGESDWRTIPEHNEATLQLLSPAGRLVGTARSGFA